MKKNMACFCAALLLTLVGCEDSQEADLFKAQACIDTATAATATSCLSFIEGQTSERAYVLKCSIAFLSEGIDESKIVSAIQNIDGNESGDPTAPTIAALTMSNTTASSEAVDTCALTGSTALLALANFANLSTAMSSLFGLLNTDLEGGDIEQAIDNYLASPSGDPAELGNAIIASQASLCSGDDGLMTSTEACSDINAAIAANPNNPTAIGNAVITNINNQND